MYLIPVILCGGVGSRLWPISRDTHPKPFIHFHDNLSLLQKTFIRGISIPNITEILTVTNKSLLLKVQNEYNIINKQKVFLSFILEPYSKNTAASIISSALYILKKYDRNAIIIILPTDHIINNENAFKKFVTQAINFTKNKKIVILGISPKYPDPSYGYIEIHGNDVINFFEKPKLDQIKKYMNSNCFLWNSGIFCCTVGTFLDEIKNYCFNILKSVKNCVEKSEIQYINNFITIDLEINSFMNIPKISIDYALMEKSKKISAIFCRNMEWYDIGSWNNIKDLLIPDKNGNCIEGKDILLFDTKNCYIRSNRVIGMIGINNIIVIDTDDALLITDKSKTQNVNMIYQKLKNKDNKTYKSHNIEYKPWGYYKILLANKNFKIKKIELKPKSCISLQMHTYRSEHWVIVQGKAKVFIEEKEMLVYENQSVYIPSNTKHRLENLGLIPLIVIEIQYGKYLEEEDIFRFSDIYHRT